MALAQFASLPAFEAPVPAVVSLFSYSDGVRAIARAAWNGEDVEDHAAELAHCFDMDISSVRADIDEAIQDTMH